MDLKRHWKPWSDRSDVFGKTKNVNFRKFNTTNTETDQVLLHVPFESIDSVINLQNLFYESQLDFLF